jgi:D-3-phosphoglycerate dehydrogenase
MGSLQSQLISGPLQEVVIEYAGDFQKLDLSPVTTAAIKGMLARVVKDDVNYVNAPVLAGDRGIKVTEISKSSSEDYMNLVTLRAITPEMTSSVSGTVFGKRDARVVIINDFRLEMSLEGHAAIIQNMDKPGAIGSIGTTLGKHNINIARMQVGQEEEGNNNIIFLRTDTPITPEALDELRALPLINSVVLLEL